MYETHSEINNRNKYWKEYFLNLQDHKLKTDFQRHLMIHTNILDYAITSLGHKEAESWFTSFFNLKGNDIEKFNRGCQNIITHLFVLNDYALHVKGRGNWKASFQAFQKR